jgi:gas vesicle protein
MEPPPGSADLSPTAIGIGAALLGACVSAIAALWRALRSSRSGEMSALRDQIAAVNIANADLVRRVRQLETTRVDESREHSAELLKESRDHANELRGLMQEALSSINAVAQALDGQARAMKERKCMAGIATQALTKRIGRTPEDADHE